MGEKEGIKMGKCCTVGNTEIVDEEKRLVKCKICGNEATFTQEALDLLKMMLQTIEKIDVNMRGGE